ncbi:SpoIIE family protein phosphatase [Chloroflexota bacterium]
MDKLQIDNIALFSSLPRSEIKYLAEVMKHVEVEAGTVLIKEGEHGEKFYIILAGQVEVIKSLGMADEQVLGKHGPADFFGEMSLFNPDGLRTASVRTCTPVELIELCRSDFDSLLQRRPLLANEMVRVLSLRLRKSDNDMIHDLRQKNQLLEHMYAELQAAQAQIVEKEKLEHELILARNIQKSILPADLALLEAFDFGARMEPARFVGGDFYDFIQLEQDTVGIAIGDVSGKGIPAAIYMALFCSLLRAEARHSNSPAEVLHRVNQHLLDLNDAGMFVTVLFGILNRKTREFVYARAGHEIPIMFDRCGEVERLVWDQGQLLGFFQDLKLDEQTVNIPAGSTLLLYTDGAFDAWNAKGVHFGLDQLREVTIASARCSAQSLCDRIIDELMAFQGEKLQFDDITLVAIQSIPGFPPD